MLTTYLFYPISVSAEIHFKPNLCNFQTNATIFYSNRSYTFIENMLNGKSRESQASLSKSWSPLALFPQEPMMGFSPDEFSGLRSGFCASITSILFS